MELHTFSFILNSGNEIKIKGTNYFIEPQYIVVYDDSTEVAIIPFDNLRSFSIDSRIKDIV